MKIRPIISLFSSACLRVLMKMMRRRIAFQSTSCEIHRKVSLALRSFGSAHACSRRFSLHRHIVAVTCGIFLTSLALLQLSWHLHTSRLGPSHSKNTITRLLLLEK